LKHNKNHGPQLDRISLELSIYQRIIAASHAFKRGRLYSIADIAKHIGATPLGVRVRALTDQWPFAKVSTERNSQRRTQLIDGDFLAEVQSSAKGATNAN
jgi:hypothetical protein